MTDASLDVAERLRYPQNAGDVVVGVKILAITWPTTVPDGELVGKFKRDTTYQVEHQCCGRVQTLKHPALLARHKGGQRKCRTCHAKEAWAIKTQRDTAREAELGREPKPHAMRRLRAGASWGEALDWHLALVFPHLREGVAHG